MVGDRRYGNVQPLDRTMPANPRILLSEADRGKGRDVQTFLCLWRRQQTVVTTIRINARRLKIPTEETSSDGGSAEQSDNATGPRTGS